MKTLVCDRFRDHFKRPPELVVRAPGRVNLLGGHIDYNDGWVLPAAIDRSLWLAAAPRRDARLHAYSATVEEGGEAALDPPPPPPRIAHRPRERWIEYPTGVAWALSQDGHALCGMDAMVVSEIPMGAGLSSSAALEVAFLLAWRELAGLPLEGAEMARLGERVENAYLDVHSGVMDQFASLHGRREHAIFLDCRNLDWELLRLPPRVAVLVADTGIRRQLVGGHVNDRQAECTEALRRLRELGCEIRALRDLQSEQLECLADKLPDSLARRARHVVEECSRVCRGAQSIREGDGGEVLGTLMRASHASSRDLYQASIPELDLLAEAASELEGCFGARLAGAGFGGCVSVLVEEWAAGPVSTGLKKAFSERFGNEPEIHRVGIGDGAEAWNI